MQRAAGERIVAGVETAAVAATAPVAAAWRRFVWRLFAVTVVTGSLALGVGFLVDNAVLTTIGAFFLANAVWMPLWR